MFNDIIELVKCKSNRIAGRAIRIPAGLILTTIMLAVSTGCAQEMSQPAEKLSHYEFNSVETTYRSGNIEIAATLLLPDTSGPFPAVVLIQGSGESSRKNQWALQIGENLASRGIAVYLPDKRGTGDSGGDWKTADFNDLAQDIVAAVKFLTTQKSIDPKSIGVVGLSQGGFYVPIVANESGDVMFVGAVSSSATPLEETVNYEMENTFRQDGLTGTAYEQAMAVQLAASQFARDGNWEAYEKALATALNGEAAGAAEEFPSTKDHWLWKWLSGVVDFDPMVYWKEVKQPIFFAYGQADESDNIPLEKCLARIHTELPPDKDVTIRVYPESGHALWDPEYVKQGKGVVRHDFTDDLAAWIFASLHKGKDSN